VSFLSDFGHADEFVGVVHAVLADLAPEVRIVDLSHGIAPHDIRGGALALARCTPYVPAGVIMAVVDPGVGTSRRAVAIEVAGGTGVFVGPDNGLLAPAVALAGGAERAVVLTNPTYQLPAPGALFSARDVFAPAAAHLCLGVELAELGQQRRPRGKLRDRGVEAWALSEENQLELTLRAIPGPENAHASRAPAEASQDRSGDVRDEVGASNMQSVSAPQSEFFVFTQVGEAIAAKPAKLEKVRLLAEYLRTLSPEQLPIAATYFTGKAFAQSDLRTLQAGWAVIYRAIGAATKLSDAELRRIARAHGDAGKSALEALEG
jgi:hypothetical protein